MGSKAVRLKDENNNKIYPCPYFPVGSIYMSVNNINPSTYFGGTWVRWGNGRVVVGVDTSQTEFNSVEKQGGNMEHSHLSAPIYGTDSTGTIYMGISNSQGLENVGTISSFYGSKIDTWGNSVRDACMYNTRKESSLQPYITCYMWKRTK